MQVYLHDILMKGCLFWYNMSYNIFFHSDVIIASTEFERKDNQLQDLNYTFSLTPTC